MKRVFEVAPGERLEGLQVVGFHGTVAPEHTPGRREPVLADSRGHLVRLERGEPPAPGEAKQRVRAQPSDLRTADLQPGNTTRLESSWPAHLGCMVVVLGKHEQAHAQALATAEPRVENSQVQEFLHWLGGTSEAQPLPFAQRLGDLVVWYCDPTEAFALYQRIARVAEKELVRAANAREKGALYDASWWLSRAALDDAERFLAAVGLERSDPGMADAYLKSTFRKKPSDELELALTHARGVLSDLCAAAQPPSPQEAPARQFQPQPMWNADTGMLSSTRNSARREFMLSAPHDKKAA